MRHLHFEYMVQCVEKKVCNCIVSGSSEQQLAIVGVSRTQLLWHRQHLRGSTSQMYTARFPTLFKIYEISVTN